MKRFFTLLLMLIPALSFTQGTPEPRTFEMKDGDTTYIMKKYWFVMLERGENANEYTKAQLDSIQAGHMANIKRCSENGTLVVAGPFGDNTSWRGILVFDVETEAEVLELLKGDTAVSCGRLKAVIHPWWTAQGTVLK